MSSRENFIALASQNHYPAGDESSNPAVVKVMLCAVQRNRAGCIQRRIKGAVQLARSNDRSRRTRSSFCTLCAIISSKQHRDRERERKVWFLFWLLIFGNYWRRWVTPDLNSTTATQTLMCTSRCECLCNFCYYYCAQKQQHRETLIAGHISLDELNDLSAPLPKRPHHKK